MNLFQPSRPLSAVATAPLVGVCLALLLAAAPLFSRVAGWAIALLVIAAATRLHLNRRAARLPSLALKVVLFGLSAGGVALTYGTMVGIEPGITVVIVLLALKVMETNGERDFQVLVLLGYFLCLCTLFFSQELLIWLYVGAVFVLLTATLVRFHRGADADGASHPIRLSATLLVQALPIIVLLFLFFPRTSTGFRFQFSRSLLGTGGMSDRLSPGSVSSLALSEEPAFRADFPDGNMPPISQMYWRGAVLWRGDGMTWVPGPQLPLERRTGQLGGAAIRQKISLQPHGGRWVFALDRPTGEGTKFEFMPGGYLLNPRLLFNTLRYEVVSRPENHELSLPVDQMRAALSPAVRPSPQVQALVDGWRRGATSGREIIERALHHFHEEKFSYSLDPGTYGDNALDEFLFTRRVGFCEHYAAAFAALMRVAGLPSRVIVGYHGGELNNRIGKYVIVRQSDAHAWTEVWLQDSGWVRVDPTEVIAPDRISSGLASFLQTRGGGAELTDANSSDTAIGWREMMRELGLAWDSINYQWDLRVLNFDEDEQHAFLAQIGLDESWTEVAGWSAGIVMVLLGGLSLWLRRPGRVPQDEAGRAWSEFCRLLAAGGVPREPWEGPTHFGQRAADIFLQHRAAILQVADLYARARYAADPPPARELLAAVRALPELRRRTNGN